MGVDIGVGGGGLMGGDSVSESVLAYDGTEEEGHEGEEEGVGGDWGRPRLGQGRALALELGGDWSSCWGFIRFSSRLHSQIYGDSMR